MSASPRSTESEQDRQMVHALSRGLSLLACFRVNRPLMTNGELAIASDMPRSSVSRLSHTLVKLGYLEYDSRRRAYRLGPKILSISNAMLGGMTLRALMQPYMRHLAERSVSQVALATCEDCSMLVIDIVMSVKMLAQPMEIGARMALDTTAMGRAYLASCNLAEQRKLIECLARDQKRELTDLLEMSEAAKKSLRDHGYCTSIHEWREGVTGIAVPLYLKHFGRRLVLTCGGSARQLTPGRIVQVIAPLLKQTAGKIEVACDGLQHL